VNASYNEKVRGVSRMWRGAERRSLAAQIWLVSAGFWKSAALCWLRGRGRVVAEGSPVPHNEM
jgi:hypothetical protein